MATKKTDLTEITPIKRFEHFLDSIAGGSNGEALDPISRIEEFLRRIAERESFQESEINRLSAIVPDPTSADTGKVLTASGEGTGSWEQASGGGGIDIILIDIASDETVTVTYNGQPITSLLDIPAGAVYSAFYRYSTLGEESTNSYKQVLQVDGYGQFVLQRTAGNQYPTGVTNFYYFTDECVGPDILSGKWIHTYNQSYYIYYSGGVS